MVIEARKAKVERKKKINKKKVRYERDYRGQTKEPRSEKEQRLKRSIVPPPFAVKLRQSKQQDEIKDLIKQMSKMNISDPTYELVYYRALKLDPVIVALVQASSMGHHYQSC